MFRRALAHLHETLGPAMLVVAGTTLVAAVALVVLPTRDAADQRFWTFAATHAEAAETASGAFLTETGRSYDVTVLPRQAMDLRLTTSLDSDSTALPDVLQLDAAAATRLLDRDGGVPFLPLDDRPELAEIIAATVPNRLDLWRRGGRLYGLSVDVHPVALAYRIDLWAEAGLDPTQAATWPELAELCQRYTAFHDRPALELNPTSSEHATLLLQQARPDAEAAASGPMLEHDALDDVLLFLANLLATDVAAPATRGHARWARDFAAGDLGILWMPDWRVAYLRAAAPELAGNVGLMPLPRWSDAGPRTAGWGGTMLAIPANTPDPDAAVELLAFLAAGEPVVEARLAGTDIVPAIGDDTLDVEADDYFASGPPRSLYAELAAHVEMPRPTADYLAAAGHVGVILSSTTADLRAELPEAEVLERLQNRLVAAQADVNRRRRTPRRGHRRR